MTGVLVAGRASADGVPVGFDAQAVGMTSALLPWVLDSPPAVKQH